MKRTLEIIAGQTHKTVILALDFLKGINLTTLVLVCAFLYFLFLRRWDLKKILSFLSVVLVLFILLVRIEAALLATFGAEGSGIGIGIAYLVFFFVTALVLIYYVAIK